MSNKKEKAQPSSANGPWIALFIFLFCFILGISKQVNFPASDLGRHLKNGEVVFQSPEVLTNNFYSYTQNDFPFINHHWLAGFLFFFVQNLMGFGGLHLFFILMMVGAMFLFFRKLLLQLDWRMALFLGVLLMPLLLFRKEIRPEGFSYLFLMVWYFLIQGWKEKPSYLFAAAAILQVVWVNTHIFFFMAPMVSFFFLMDDWLKDKRHFKTFGMVLSIQVLCCLANPNFVLGAISPLAIFKEYGYMVSENQSVFFMQGRVGVMPYLHVELLALLFIVGVVWAIRKSVWKDFLPELLLGFVGILFGLLAIRGFTFMGLTIGLAFARMGRIWYDSLLLVKKGQVNGVSLVLALGLGIFGVVTKNYAYSYTDWSSGLGLIKGSNQAGAFFKKAGIKGPIFNNYDIGSYVIYHHFPMEKVFTDNRPEAYSKAFFDTLYNPCLKDESNWKKVDAKFGFNCIYFYRHDNTEFGQPFLIRRINDEEWIPVFVDDFNIVLLRNRPENAGILKQFALDKSIFRSVPGN
jgi:hypothetical protein